MKCRHALGAIAAATCLLSGCSTSFWYLQAQALQYEKCDKLADAEDRRRCRAETRPDEEKYRKQREAARGTSGN
jgi:outer membrane murein-binding lipoprotein Lpp